MKTLVVLVENKPGVLNRVVSLIRKRGFNIDSLTVGRTENSELSRMTITVDGCPNRVATQLRKLINVVSIQDVTEVPNLRRDLALIKVRITPNTRAEVLRVADIFRANVVDAGTEMLEPFGILEMVRTGVVAMTRGSAAVSTQEYKPRPYKNGNTPQPKLTTTNGPFVV